jgi:3-hydroxyacyl-CoA dehydrogenase/enoyl-CoA hydratase/3-hydroxybutyryl-CoA epimerase
MEEHLGERVKGPPSTAKALEDGRRGRKNKKGFYTYDGGKKRVDESVYTLLPGGTSRRRFARGDIQERLVYAFLNEATRCLEEDILRSPRDGDVGAVFGLGFPPFLGGPFRYMDRLGAGAVVATLEGLEGQHGPRFRPAALLADMAREGESFYVAA